MMVFVGNLAFILHDVGKVLSVFKEEKILFNRCTLASVVGVPW